MLNKNRLNHTPNHTLRNMPTGVSIVIPNWNHEYLLPRSIQSALMGVKQLQQHDIPADVLVIDDHSRDGSLTLLRQLEALYFDDGLRLIALPENVGVVAVRNLALECASYRYILFMDADNELIPENIYMFVRAIQDTEAAMVYGNLIRRGPVAAYVDMFNNESFQNHIFQRNYIDTFSLYDRHQIFDVRGYQSIPMMQSHEDWELILHLAASGRKMVFVPVLMGIYYDLPSSFVNPTRSAEFEFERKSYIDRVFNQLGIRFHQEPNTYHLRYHPDVGYI
ncbi:MAG: hypothetical protein CUN54_05910 [Phototrophicales bacterium]|nr:MAG: hypothetical protein CUN54_05910 [Phototrophicales bacterium]